MGVRSNHMTRDDYVRLWNDWGTAVESICRTSGKTGKPAGPRTLHKELRRLGLDITVGRAERLYNMYRDGEFDSVDFGGSTPASDVPDMLPDWTDEMQPEDDQSDLDFLTDDPDTQELLAITMRQYKRAKRYREPKIHRIKRSEPWGLVHFGDPHLDDAGCDFPQLLRDLRAARKYNMHGVNVGDTLNNWPFAGRLAAKWADQHDTKDDSFLKAKWFFRAIRWDVVMDGNHDLWNDASRVLKLMGVQAPIRVHESYEARVVYDCGEGVEQRMIVRHYFKGNSQYNAVHGGLKRAQQRGWGHLFVDGHTHTSAQITEEDSEQHHFYTVIKPRGYKKWDDYAQAKDFPELRYAQCMVTLHDPWHPHPGERIKVFYDIETAGAVLELMKEKHAAR